ncbi:DUF5916 domain-containing protein [Gemmatimonadota bacterium]
MSLLGVALIALTWGFLVPLAGQGQSISSVGGTPTPFAVAARALPSGPNIDGNLDDQVWQSAIPFSDFTQREPNEGEAPTEETEVRVLYTDAALYVAIRAWDSRPDEIAAQLTRRDIESPSDWLGIAIDSYRDRRTAFVFLVNPVGVKRDIYFFDDGDEDETWDAVWDVGTTRDEQGWTAEFKIPFSQLRFPNSDRHRFGFNVYRKINRSNEELFWRVAPKAEPGFVSRFGDLDGIEGIRPPQRVEILPYTVLTGARTPSEQGNPFQDGTSGNASFGGDLKFGLTSNITVDATFNPDFGQVEADPAVVNLTAFESFFPERRPFFNEGSDIFRFSIGLGDGDMENESLFYTRRIGRAPQGEADDRGGYAERIPQTTIYGAAKVSGRTPGGWTVGLATAVTAEEEAQVVDADGTRFYDVVEPRSEYMVGRIARDFRGGLTQVGFFGTAVRRELPENLQYLRSSAVTFGANWNHRFLNDTYSFSGRIVGSRVGGSEEAIEQTQRSAAHLYQRPDNDYLTLDPTRTSLTGFASQVSIGKIAGDWRFSTGFDTRSPGFEANDLGFMRDADRTIQWVWIQRRWQQPGKVFRSFFLNFNQWSVFNYGWDRMNTGGNVNLHFTLLNYWNGGAGVNADFAGLSGIALRGGPAFIQPGSWNVWFNFNSDYRKPIRSGLFGHIWRQPETGSWSWGVSQNLSWRVAGNLDFTAAPGINRELDTWQYLQTEDALGETEYVFGELHQTTVNMMFRGNLTFTPVLSLQLYMQPFISAGDYRSYSRVTDPRGTTWDDRIETFNDEQVFVTDGDVSVDLNRDGAADLNLENPDFTYLSFRSNAVLRWEYSPGSTVFFVWQHGRSEYNSGGEFNLRSGFSDLFGADASNTFLVKVNYWLGR